VSGVVWGVWGQAAMMFVSFFAGFAICGKMDGQFKDRMGEAWKKVR